MWPWLLDIFLNKTYALNHYEGTPVELRQKPFTEDLTFFRIGAVRLRQNRIKKGDDLKLTVLRTCMCCTSSMPTHRVGRITVKFGYPGTGYFSA